MQQIKLKHGNSEYEQANKTAQFYVEDVADTYDDNEQSLPTYEDIPVMKQVGKDVTCNRSVNLESVEKDAKSVHILFADDEPTILQLFSRILGQLENIKYETAMNGQEAVEKWKNKKYFDLVILDFSMPFLNGV